MRWGIYYTSLHFCFCFFILQELIKQATHQDIPDFYNILLERPAEDSWGYDLLYVDAYKTGSYVGRISHSCRPNCSLGVVAVSGRLCIALYTIRDVHEGSRVAKLRLFWQFFWFKKVPKMRNFAGMYVESERRYVLVPSRVFIVMFIYRNLFEQKMWNVISSCCKYVA